jgi:multiple sugar transport system permease protein
MDERTARTSMVVGAAAPRAGAVKPTAQPLASGARRHRAVRRALAVSLRYLALLALSTLFVLPFLWMVGTSLTPPDQILNRHRPLFPSSPQWSNYADALTAIDPLTVSIFGHVRKIPAFAMFLQNTLTIAILCTIGQTLSCACVAFAFARLRFPYRNALFVLVLSTMMLPPQVTMIPRFILFTYPVWIDSLKPLIVPSFFATGAFFIFLLRQFFMTIPRELEEAARLDGCSTFGVFRHVVLPLSKPALITVALFAFIENWNDFLGPLIYTTSLHNKTLALGLNAFKTLQGTEYHLLMAASVSVLVPILVIFFVAQRYFVEGIATTGVKG